MSEIYKLIQGPHYQEITYNGGYIRIEEIVGILNGNENRIERNRTKRIGLEKERDELKAKVITRDSFEWELIEKLNSETMKMSYNDGPQKGWIRELYKILDKKLPKEASK